MKKILIILCVFFLFGCGSNKLKTKGVETELIIKPNSEVAEECKLYLESYDLGYENDTCYNISPDFLEEIKVFKFDKSSATFIIYENNIYQLGEFYGGNGVTSMALADLNSDKEYELYYTYSYGSDIHRSQVGFFDFNTKQISNFSISYLYEDIMLTVEDGQIFVNNGEINLNSYVDFEINAKEKRAKIVYENDSIQLISIDEEAK